MHRPHDVPFQVAERIGRDRHPLRLVHVRDAAGAVAQRARRPARVAFDATGELCGPEGPALLERELVDAVQLLLLLGCQAARHFRQVFLNGGELRQLDDLAGIRDRQREHSFIGELVLDGVLHQRPQRTGHAHQSRLAEGFDFGLHQVRRQVLAAASIEDQLLRLLGVAGEKRTGPLNVGAGGVADDDLDGPGLKQCAGFLL